MTTRSRFLRTTDGLVSGVGFSSIAQGIPLLTSLAITPYLISVLGLDGFGVWSLLFAVLGTLTMLDGGVGASLSRFYAVHRVRGGKDEVGRLVIGSLLLFLALGAVVSVLSFALAPVVVDSLNIPRSLHRDAVLIFQLLGPLLTLALVSDSATSLLQASSRFPALAGVTFCSSGAYIVSIVVLIGASRSLVMLAVALALRYVVLLVGGFALAAREMTFSRPLLPGRLLRREFRDYALRMQVSGMTSIFNQETDALVIGAVLPVRYVGLYAVGYQAATALRSLPLYAFPPILTKMSSVFAKRGLGGAIAEFNVLEARWLPTVLGYGAVAISAVGFGVEVWLGPGYGVASSVAIVLTVGYMVQVAVTGIRTCFVRALGRPGLETRYSLLASAINLVLTIPFALAFGVIGVVAATTVGVVVGSLYFVRLCDRVATLRDRLPSLRWLLAAALAVTVTVMGELLVRRTGLHGVLPLALAVVPALAGLAIVAGEQLTRPIVVRLAPSGASVDAAWTSQDTLQEESGRSVGAQ